jgi:hypothetical protein
MNDPHVRSVLRLRKKHDPALAERPTAADGARLVEAQSVLYGFLAGLASIAIFILLWVLVTDLLRRLLPWLTILLGALVGLAVRRGGQGFDWRFPVLAALLTLLGALAGLIVISAGTSARELDTTTWNVILHVTTLTWPVFFDEVVTAADVIFAGTGAVIAAFLSPRPLNRREFQAVRAYREAARD